MHKFDLGQTVEYAFYRSSAPRTLPVARLTKCTCAHARQLTVSKVSTSDAGISSADQPYTLSPVFGQR
jgi:hypothetical protein